MSPKKKKKPSSLDLVFRNNNIQSRCSLDLVSPNNDTNGVDANKRKVYYTKKENPSSLDPVRTTIVQIHIPKQNMLRNKTISFLCLTWSARTIICMQILTRDSEDTFFSCPFRGHMKQKKNIFSHKKPPHLTWSVQTTN